MYDFNTLWHKMGFNLTLHSYIEANNPEKIANLICAAYESVNPMNYRDHPCFEMIRAGLNVLTANGWKWSITGWKENGDQLVVLGPSGEFYHSNYLHTRAYHY